RMAVQHQLSVLGFYRSNVDGDFGPGTRKAIKSFQRDNRLEATGYVTEETLALLARKSSLRETQLAEQQWRISRQRSSSRRPSRPPSKTRTPISRPSTNPRGS